jgi:hydroxyatrazine ethylaminohydrolase
MTLHQKQLQEDRKISGANAGNALESLVAIRFTVRTIEEYREVGVHNHTLIRKAKAVVTCDAADHILHDVDIRIEEGKITRIGAGLDPIGCEIIDASHSFVYPGLINTHHHFFQTFVRNLMSIDYPNMLVVEWLDRIYRVFKEIDSDVIYHSSLTAMADLVKHGCTCAFDHQYCYTKKTGTSPVDRQMEAASRIGLRYHAGRGCNTLPRSQGSTIPDEMLETTDVFLADCERLIDAYHEPDPFGMHRIVVAPCQPINSHPHTFIESAAFARDKHVRLHTHLGEGENPIMKARHGKRTLAWCEEIGFVGPDVWFAHAWELDAHEHAVLAATGSGVSHCPAPATLGGFPILDIPGMLEKNVPLSLGCDGSATNDSSNLLDSLRMAYLMQAFHGKSRNRVPSPYEMLKIATVGGAQALGRSELGSLEVGKAADLFFVDVDTLELCGTLHDPANLIARAGVCGPVERTIVAGKTVWEHGRFPTLDERELAREGNRICTERMAPHFPL